MTLEEAQKLIEEGTRTKNFTMIEEGLAVIKANQKPAQEGVSTIVRNNPNKDGNRVPARREPINLNKVKAFNLFADDGKEHAEEKLKPEEKGKWGTTDNAREPVQLKKVLCSSCNTAYEVHPSLAKPIDINPDGTTHNPNICDGCVRKKGKR